MNGSLKVKVYNSMGYPGVMIRSKYYQEETDFCMHNNRLGEGSSAIFKVAKWRAQSSLIVGGGHLAARIISKKSAGNGKQNIWDKD